MKAPLSYVPALPAAVGLSCGIIADTLGGGIIAAAVGVTLFMALYACRRHYAALCSLMVASGAILAMSHHAVEPATTLFGEKHSYEAQVKETSESTTSTSYTAEITSVDSRKCRPFLILATVGSVASPAEPGATIRFATTLQPLDRPEEMPHETDYSTYLKARGITARGFVNGSVEETAPATGLQALANSIRSRIYNAIVDSPVDGSTAAFLVAAILGDRSHITADEYASYRDTGVAHILALSGLHVGIIASLFGLLLFPLRLIRRGCVAADLLSALTVWAYAIVAGLTPSILRAAVMITVIILARLTGRGANGYNSLSLAVVVILCADPMSLFTPGFQLSVAAVASILMFGGVLPTRLRRHRALYFTASLMVTSVSAIIGTGIVSAYYFNTFPTLFLAGNIITGILFPFILGGGIVLAAFTAMGISFGPLGMAVEALHALMQWSVTRLGEIDGSAMRDIYFSAWVILPYSIAVVMLALAIHYRKRTLWIMTMTMVVVTYITADLTREHLPAAEMYIPSGLRPASVIMRAGDNAWIYTPGEKDGGSALADANLRYRRFLLSRGCGRSFILAVDTLSHPTFRVRGGLIAAADRTIAVADAGMPEVSGTGVHVDYALVTSGYRGKIDRVVGMLHPDTILLAPDIHPSRRASLIRQCADTIPYRNLRSEALAIRW